MLHRTTARDVFSDGTIAETSEVCQGARRSDHF